MKGLKDRESTGGGGQESLSFEDALNRLDQAVQALESGGLTLEDATKLYDDGMRLVRLCNQLLSKAELKVTQLKDVYSDYLDPRQPEDEEEEDRVEG